MEWNWRISIERRALITSRLASGEDAYRQLIRRRQDCSIRNEKTKWKEIDR